MEIINRNKELQFTVLKFGGSSVASPGCWHHIANALSKRGLEGLGAGHPVLVCSALAGVTDMLAAWMDAAESGASTAGFLGAVRDRHRCLAAELGLDVDEVLGQELAALAELVADGPGHDGLPAAWRARVLSCGELMSTRLGATWLGQKGLRIRWLDARTVLTAVPDESGNPSQAYLSARCDDAPAPALQAQLARSRDIDATITQGFIARNPAGETVLLGRGGSDTSAAYLAAMLEAERLEIWTDVPGLFTADPRRTPHARLVPQVTYDEAAVLGSLGASILHPRCLAPVKKRGIPLAVRWTHRPSAQGTQVGDRSDAGIKAITSRSELCLVRMQRNRSWQPVGFMADVSRCFHDHGLSMDLISSSPAEIRATIDLEADPGAGEKMPHLMAALAVLCQPSIRRQVACISVAGTRISQEMSRIAGILHLLGKQTLHLVSHAADDSHVSYVVDAAVANDLVVAFHAAVFDRSRNPSEPTWRELQGLYAPEPGSTAGDAAAFARPPTGRVVGT